VHNIWNYDGIRPTPRANIPERNLKEKPNKGVNEAINVEKRTSDESVSSLNVASLEKKLKHEYKENIAGYINNLLKIRK
jgi:hypothetical protein